MGKFSGKFKFVSELEIFFIMGQLQITFQDFKEAVKN